MGRVERDTARKVRRRKIGDSILLILTGQATINARISGPDAGRLLRTFDPEFDKKRSPSGRVREALRRHEKNGLVTLAKDGNYRLTSKGEIATEKMLATHAALSTRPAQWDGKWRIIVFDVWERRRDVRDRLRRSLQDVGFVQLQQSVWVYPYPCEELVAFLRAEMRLGPALLYIIAEGIENDRSVRRHFRLP